MGPDLQCLVSYICLTHLSRGLTYNVLSHADAVLTSSTGTYLSKTPIMLTFTYLLLVFKGSCRIALTPFSFGPAI